MSSTATFLSQTLEQARHFEAGGHELRSPAVGVGLVCHVVVRVVARDHHERREHGLLVACGARGGDNILAGRFSLDGADEELRQALVLKHFLHLGIVGVGIGFGAVAHEAQRRLAVVEGRHVLLNGCGHLLVVVVGGEQRVAERDFVELVGVLVELVFHVGVFRPPMRCVGCTTISFTPSSTQRSSASVMLSIVMPSRFFSLSMMICAVKARRMS